MDNGFSRRHPAVLMVYFLLIFGVTVLTGDPVPVMLSLAGGLLAGGDRKTAGFAFGLALLVAVTNPLFAPLGETVLFRVFGRPYPAESLLYGAVTGAMVAAVLLWGACLSRVMNQENWMILLGKRFPRLALVLSMSLRLIPLLRRRGEEIHRARKTMLRTSDATRRRKTVAWFGTVTVLLRWILERALDIGRSMQARGYGAPGRTHYAIRKWDRADSLWLTVCAVLTALTVWGWSAGLTYYPRLMFPPLTVRQPIGYAAFGVLSLLPVMAEGKERGKWVFCKHRI